MVDYGLKLAAKALKDEKFKRILGEILKAGEDPGEILKLAYEDYCAKKRIRNG